METKHTEIDGLKIKESKSTQLFGTDALLLSAYVRKSPSALAAELGAGSGAISVILAERGAFKNIKAVEIQEDLYRLCEHNVRENGLSDKVTPICADIRTLAPSELSGVSAIFTNPPYMRTGGGKESPESSKQTARHEVFGGAREFISFAGRVLKTGGKLYTVYRPDRLETLMKAFSESGFAVKRMTFVAADKDHEPSSVLTEAIRGGKESLYLTPSLFLTDGNGCESADAAYIYKNGTFPEKFFER